MRVVQRDGIARDRRDKSNVFRAGLLRREASVMLLAVLAGERAMLEEVLHLWIAFVAGPYLILVLGRAYINGAPLRSALTLKSFAAFNLVVVGLLLWLSILANAFYKGVTCAPFRVGCPPVSALGW